MSQLYTLLGMLAGAGTVLLGFLKFRPERDLAVAQTAKELIDPLRERVRELIGDNEGLASRVAKLEDRVEADEKVERDLAEQVKDCLAAMDLKDDHITRMEAENRELTVRLEDALERIAVLEALMANAGVTLPASLVRTRRDQRSDDQSHQEGT